MKIDDIHLHLGRHIGNVNTAKNLTLKKLVKEGVISEEQASSFKDKWHFVIIKNSWIKRLSEKLTKGESDEYSLHFIEIDPK